MFWNCTFSPTFRNVFGSKAHQFNWSFPVIRSYANRFFRSQILHQQQIPAKRFLTKNYGNFRGVKKSQNSICRNGMSYFSSTYSNLQPTEHKSSALPIEPSYHCVPGERFTLPVNKCPIPPPKNYPYLFCSSVFQSSSKIRQSLIVCDNAWLLDFSKSAIIPSTYRSLSRDFIGKPEKKQAKVKVQASGTASQRISIPNWVHSLFKNVISREDSGQKRCRSLNNTVNCCYTRPVGTEI